MGTRRAMPPRRHPQVHQENMQRLKPLGRRASVTTEGGQAAQAAGPGAAPVQVAERLQANSTCGHSTAIRQVTQWKSL